MGADQSGGGYYGNFDGLMNMNVDLSALNESLKTADFSNIPVPELPKVEEKVLSQAEIDRQFLEQTTILSTNLLGRGPTQTEINQAYGTSSPYYKETFEDRLRNEGQFNPWSQINPDTNLSSIIRFLDGSTMRYADIRYADEFKQAGYNIGLRDGAYFALKPGQSVEQALEVKPPTFSINQPVIDNVVDAAINKPQETIIQTTLAENIEWLGNPELPTVWNPPQFEKQPEKTAVDPQKGINYEALIMVGGVLFAIWLVSGKKKE